MNTDLLSCRFYHNAIVKYLDVDELEVIKDERNYVEKPHFSDGKETGKTIIFGQMFRFKRNGKTYGVRLDPMTKPRHIEPCLFDEIFLGYKTIDESELDSIAMIQELKRIINTRAAEE